MIGLRPTGPVYIPSTEVANKSLLAFNLQARYQPISSPDSTGNPFSPKTRSPYSIGIISLSKCLRIIDKSWAIIFPLSSSSNKV